MSNDKWYCEVQAPPELHEHIEQLFNAISYKIRHADGYIEGYKYGLEKSIEPNLSNNGSIYTKTGVNDEDRITDDLISRQAVMKEFSDFVRKSNNSDFAPTPTWNDAVSLVGSMPSAQPTQTNADSTHENTLDCVSRQDVLKILSSKNAAWDAYDKVKQLPSVQPVNYGSTKSDSSSQLKLNNDLISRQALCEYTLNQKDKSVTPNDIMRFPSAQPRKNGKWIPDNNCYYETRYICSECKLPFRVETFMMKPSWRFCPNCGARMDGGEGDET